MASATERDLLLAQAGTGPVLAAAERPLAGAIEQVTGQVFILKLDGSRVAARNGAQIFEGDIVVTQSGAGAIVVFDRAVAALAGDARMLVETGGAQPVFFVLQGQFGMQVLRGAPNTPDQVTVRTPVSSVVLRQGRMLGRAAAEAVSNSFVLLPNVDGSAGVMHVTTAAGGVLLDRPLQGTTVVSLFRSPMPALDRDLASLQGEFSGFLAGWLPTSRPVATSSLLPDTLLGMLGIAGDTLAQRGSRLLDLIFPPAAAAAAFEFAPGPSPEQMFVPTPPSATPQQVPPPAQPPGGTPTPDTPQNLTFDFSRGSSTITGGAAFDLLTVTADPVQPNSISIGADAQGRVVLVNGNGSTIQVDNVEELTVNLGRANDRIVLGDLSSTDIADSTVTIHAGAGDDSIDGSLAGKRLVLFGDEGNDTLIGGSKNDDLFGGTGDDLLTGNGGNDRIEGGDGNDTLNGGTGNDSLKGDGGDDLLSGGDDNDLLMGGEGNDTLAGDAGNDTLSGEAGLDSLSGGEGNDSLSGGEGNDSLAGGTGNDTLTGDAGDDTLAGDDGNDSLSGGDGNDNLAGGLGNDTLAGDAGDDTLSGGDGDDSLAGGAGNDQIDGGAGDDRIVWQTGAGNDTATGGAGNDRLDATVSGTVTLAQSGAAAVLTAGDSISLTGVETLNLGGSAGNDSFSFGNLSATAVTTLSVDAGAGTDSASFVGAGAVVTIDLAAGTATGFAQFLGFEAVTGSAFADTLRGSAGSDALSGGSGNDSIDARGGNDTVSWATGDGNDTIEGGSGTDTLAASISGAVSLTRSGSTAVLSAGATVNATGIEVVRLTGGGGDDSFTLGNLAGALNSVEILGGGGTDTAIFTNVPGGVTVDLAAGTAALNGTVTASLQSVESVVGSDQRDTLLGSSGSDVLSGGTGADTIDGRGGDDRIVFTAGDGNDTVEGGAGNDVLEVNFAGATLALSNNAGALRVDVAVAGPDDRLQVRTVETLRLIAGTGNDSITIGGGAGSTIQLGDLSGTDITTVEVRGGSGNDLLDASAAGTALRLFGEDGNDTLIGGSGNDLLQGDGGTDTASFAGAGAAVNVDLGAGTASGGSIGNDSLSGIERVIGSAFADTITGSSGNDTLDGNLGNDILSGGGGFDMVDYSGATAAIGIDLTQAVQSSTGGYGTDTLSGFEGVIGSAFADTITGDGNANLLIGGNGNDSLIGGDGNDTLMGGLGTNTLDGGLGTDTADFSDLSAGQTVDLSSSALLTSIENLTGGSGNDSFTGTSGANLLVGGAGNDTLSGNGGLDTLVGGLGADLLTGSNGEAQAFRFNASNEGGDTITAFESGTDRLQVSAGGFGVGSIVDGQTFFQATLGSSLGVSTATFIFDSGTGNFAFDSDGDGAAAAVVLATLQSGTVQATDLQVF